MSRTVTVVSPSGREYQRTESEARNMVESTNGAFRIKDSSSSGSSYGSSSNSSSSRSSSNIPANLPSAQQIGNNTFQGIGYAYVDKYGFSHVVGDLETAQKYSGDGNVYMYDGVYGGGYALDQQGSRATLNLPGSVPYGNDVRKGIIPNQAYGSWGTPGNMTIFNPTQPFVPQQNQQFNQGQLYQGQSYEDFYMDYIKQLEFMKKQQDYMFNQYQKQQQQVQQDKIQSDKYLNSINNKLNQSNKTNVNQQMQYSNNQKIGAHIKTDAETGKPGAVSRYLAQDIWKDRG